MLNKNLIAKRFSKSFKNYNDNAFIQNIMANNLVQNLPYKEFDSVFEIGCGTGLLTQKIKDNLKFNNFVANDIVDCSKYINEIICSNKFICGDIEEIEINGKFDLIISNACLQWCKKQDKTIQKLKTALNNNGLIAISVFGKKNLCEIKEVFDTSLEYTTLEDLKNIFDDYKCIYFEEKTKKLYFDKPLDVIKHFKNTGVNSLTKINFTKRKLKEFENNFTSKFYKEGKVYITYNPIYAIFEKK